MGKQRNRAVNPEEEEDVARFEGEGGDQTAPALEDDEDDVTHTEPVNVEDPEDVLRLQGQAAKVFNEFMLDDEPFVMVWVKGEAAVRVVSRDRFDDQTGWLAPISLREAEDPAGIGEEDGIEAEAVG